MRSLLLVIFVTCLTGCGALDKFVPSEQAAVSLAVTDTQSDLLLLPEPKGRIPVSVYSFRDQTGQYKPLANVSSFSTAVTQGATSILMQALTDSNWFIAIEREGLQNILTERKIIRASKQAKEKETGQPAADLPPLATAKMLLEGGIISYDSNTRTGGLGAKYFGISASELYREDQISVYLRAVDVRSGQVLVSVATSKTVLSQEVRAGFFRFVSFKRLAEAEAGYTNNEPMHVCVKQAIEKALADLVLKGIERGVWAGKNKVESS